MHHRNDILHACQSQRNAFDLIMHFVPSLSRIKSTHEPQPASEGVSDSDRNYDYIWRTHWWTCKLKYVAEIDRLKLDLLAVRVSTLLPTLTILLNNRPSDSSEPLALYCFRLEIVYTCLYHFFRIPTIKVVKAFGNPNVLWCVHFSIISTLNVVKCVESFQRLLA